MGEVPVLRTLWKACVAGVAGQSRPDGTGRRPARLRRPDLGAERLESRALMAVAQLTKVEVDALLQRASAATPSNDAIIAVVDRTGQILGVRVEDGVSLNDLGFKIDGAVAKARTGAFFSNGQAILTSRTVSHISQSTVTQREMQANPASVDPTFNGPGYVAPVGIGGEFPPGIVRQPLVDLFAIEHTNRTSVVVGGTVVTNRASYAAQVAGTVGAVGSQQGQPPQPLARGISTMPGGVGIYRVIPVGAPPEDQLNALVGGIGVFFPGSDGTATFEQGFVASANQTRTQRLNAPKALEAELAALLAVSPYVIPPASVPALPTPLPQAVLPAPPEILRRIGTLPPLPLTTLPELQSLLNRVNVAARINLGGVALQSFGPQAGPLGVQTLINLARQGGSGPVNGTNEVVAPGGVRFLKGTPQPDGWLVGPTAGTSLTAAQVKQIIDQGVAQAAKTRAQIRVQPTATKMVFAVADTDGAVLGVYRMPDATVFSIDVAIAKARNTAYYASAALQPQDSVGTPLGTAFTNRTFRYLAVPKYPSGNASAPPGPFSILNTPGIDPRTGLNIGAPPTAAVMGTTVLGRDSFVTGSNFRAPTPAANQNGIVFFPGSTAVYRGTTLSGGFGVSGDGVDQDDVVTFYGIAGYAAPTAKRADQFFVRGIRLPYIKFSRNAEAGAS
jgi:uncharacterized protein GlcG (DUF336 family)